MNLTRVRMPTVVVKGMDAKGIEKIEDKIENVEHVTDIISITVW